VALATAEVVGVYLVLGLDGLATPAGNLAMASRKSIASAKEHHP